jgi:outer membrane lipoprotein SlyB
VRKFLLVTLPVFLVAGCAQPGANLEANVYQAGQVNQRQAAKVVSLLAVLPAKIQVSNAQNRQTAQLVGGLLGAIGGAALGGGLGHNAGTALFGGVAGGGAGAVAGSLVPDSALVEGVSLTYIEDGRTLNSAQVGQACEFKPGDAIVISTSPTETRIQPNATCPVASR